MIRAADIIIDATASDECWHALAFLCREAAKPLAIGYATEGAAGGVVISIPGNAPFCLSCVSRHWEDETLPQPAVDPTGTVLPIGCNQPTFTGGGFDLQEVSRSEEHTSELQSLMRISYAVFCLKKKDRYKQNARIRY